MRRGSWSALILAFAASPAALAWNAHGHRTVTLLALDGLKPETPSWLREPATTARIAEEACEPDRWRGVRRSAIEAELNTDHYIDAEDLPQFGMSLQSLPRLRYEYVEKIITARAEHPELAAELDLKKDPFKTKEFPGFLPWAIEQHYELLVSSFNTLRILDGLHDPSREAALEEARQNVVHEMGILSHFVGDGAQPLHTTRHHHGWVGENPNGYTTAGGFHAYIDGAVLQIHALDYDSLKGNVKFDTTVDPKDPWPQSMAYLARSFEQVEPLYKMQKDGSLEKDAGKEEITARLCDAASMLAAMYNAAWEASAPTQGEVSNFVKYSEVKDAGKK